MACNTIVFETIGAAPGTGAATTDPIVDAKLKSKSQKKVFVSISLHCKLINFAPYYLQHLNVSFSHFCWSCKYHKQTRRFIMRLWRLRFMT